MQEDVPNDFSSRERFTTDVKICNQTHLYEYIKYMLKQFNQYIRRLLLRRTIKMIIYCYELLFIFIFSIRLRITARAR